MKFAARCQLPIESLNNTEGLKFGGVTAMLRATLIFLSLICFGFSTSSYAASIAKVVAVAGSPLVAGPSGKRTLASGSELFEHDKVTVGSGNAQILFVDGTKLVVGPGSTLMIERFLLRGGTTAQNLSINALRGTFRFITGKSAKSAYNIRTANATIGIRGTGFDFWVKSNTGVAVLEGKVKLCNISKNCVNLNAGCELGVTKKNAAEKLFGQPKSQVISEKLPFILNQSPLVKAFRLNVSSCRKTVGFGLDSQENFYGNKQRDTPPTQQTPGTPTPPTRTTSPNGP
jgi:FecR protein